MINGAPRLGRTFTAISALASALALFVACGGDEAPASAGSGGSAESPSDAGLDAKTSDAGEDAGGDAAPPPQPVFTDSGHALMWQKTQKMAYEVWSDAQTYCQGLMYGGFDDWRLPTIDELRTIVVGCPASESGGACGVGASCLPETCGGVPCDGCPGSQGPSAGCYRVADLDGDCTLTWSSSVDPASPLGAWYVNFSNARIRYDDQALYHAIRCVRDAI